MVDKEKIRKPSKARYEHILAAYGNMDGVADELMDQAGNIRPVWKEFVDYLASLSAENLDKRFKRGDQYLRDAGVFFRQYDDDETAERDWPFSHIPILLDEAEWQTISQGLMQRANLLEYVMADLYGNQSLVEEGHLPACLIGATPEWLRAMVGSKPKSGFYLHLLAFEIGRGPDGRWWVLGDRTQAPSGAGFALENRVATTHVFGDFYAKAQIHRLAGFFKSFRDRLNALSQPQDCGVGILTPGRLNDAYFEHAYIARYLGFMLLEGEDLVIRDGQTMVRTIEGLQPISVLWRRLDSSFADPLELNEDSILGTPGLANIAKNGALNLVNALGSGVLENRFMLSFLPRICKEIFGEELLLPNIATWWCGQEQERQHVLSSSDKLMFGPAHSTYLPFEQNEMFSLLDADQDENIRDQIMKNGQRFVAQEAIKLSTTPVFINDQLRARPMTIRVFMARDDQGWTIMPGGYARIGDEKGPTVLALQGGGQVADVWIKSPKEIEAPTLVNQDGSFNRITKEVLPSRAADNLFWLGRYIERAEMIIRLIRAYHARLAEHDDKETPLLKFISTYFKNFQLDEKTSIADSLVVTLRSAMGSAGHIRDRFSNDGWIALKDLASSAEKILKQVNDGDDAIQGLQVLLRKISGFSGLVHDSMYHYTGWRFMKIGRALERGALTASLLEYFTQKNNIAGTLEVPVEICDSVMTHRRRYVVTTNKATVVDLLALDGMNPRSILFQIDEFKEHLRYLPGEAEQFSQSKLAKQVLKLHTDLVIAAPENMKSSSFKEIEENIYVLCNLLSETYLS